VFSDVTGVVRSVVLRTFFAMTHFTILGLLFQNSSHSEHNISICRGVMFWFRK